MRRTGFLRPDRRASQGSFSSTSRPLSLSQHPIRGPRSTSSLAASASTSVSTLTTQASAKRELPPLELYEYGDPLSTAHLDIQRPALRDGDERHLRYLDAQALKHIRHVERLAGRTLVGAASALVPINGAKVLLLASGRGATVGAFAKLGPAALTLVDADADVVRDAVGQVELLGQSASVSVFPEVGDAWDFARTTDDTYDLIVCVHAIGQIIRDRPGSVEDFLTDVSGLLAPGGVLIADEHLGFTDSGSPAPASVPDRVDRYVATGLGGFSTDVNYLLPRVLPGCVRRCEWVTPGSPHPMQRWYYIAFERRSDEEAPRAPGVVSYPRLGGLPSCGPVSDPSVFEMMYPRASRGSKIPMGREDRRAIAPGRLMPKIDGEAAVVVFQGDVALHYGPRYGGTFRLPFSFEVPHICTGELVTSSDGERLLVITGIFDKGGRPVDPSSNAELRTLDAVQDQLSTVGVVVNTPALTPHVSGNRVYFPRSPGGKNVPVDGLGVLCGGRWGKFFKPSSTLSVDVSPTDWPLLVGNLTATIRLVRPFGTVDAPVFPATAPLEAPSPVTHDAVSTVLEVGVKVDGLLPRLVMLRERRDKQASDGLGKLIVFMSAVRRVTPLVSEVDTVSRLVNYLNTG